MPPNAYFAGLFDGEGTLTIFKTGAGDGCLSLIAAITMQTKAPLELCQAKFGGSLRESRPAPNQEKAVWHWRLSSKATIRALLDAIEPYAIVKGKHIEIARLFLEATDIPTSEESRKLKEELRLQIRALNFNKGRRKPERNLLTEGGAYGS